MNPESVIKLSFSYRVITIVDRWPLKKSDYPLVAPCIFSVTSMAGIVFKLAFLDHAVESAVGFCSLKLT